MICYYYITINR